MSRQQPGVGFKPQNTACHQHSGTAAGLQCRTCRMRACSRGRQVCTPKFLAHFTQPRRTPISVAHFIPPHCRNRAVPDKDLCPPHPGLAAPAGLPHPLWHQPAGEFRGPCASWGKGEGMFPEATWRADPLGLQPAWPPLRTSKAQQKGPQQVLNVSSNKCKMISPQQGSGIAPE